VYDYARETDLLDSLSAVDEPLSAVVERFGSVERARDVVWALCRSGLAFLRTGDGDQVQDVALRRVLLDERSWANSTTAVVLCGTREIESLMGSPNWRQRLQRAFKCGTRS
jgi:hypothetical protein